MTLGLQGGEIQSLLSFLLLLFGFCSSSASCALVSASCCWFAHIKSECNASVTQVEQFGKLRPKISRWTAFSWLACSPVGWNTWVCFHLSKSGCNDRINSILLIVWSQVVRQSPLRWMRKVSPPIRKCIKRRTTPTTMTGRKHNQVVSSASICGIRFRRDSVSVGRLVCRS